MPTVKPARLLRIHLCESDTSQGRPAYEAIVGKCMELGISGATVFRGLEGYGETAEVHRSGLLRADQPIVVVIVDEGDRIDTLLLALESVMKSGTIAISDVEMIRVNRNGSRRDEL